MTQDLDSPGGLGRYFPLARELAKFGHTVVISTLHPDFDSVAPKSFSVMGVNVRYVGQMHVQKQGKLKSYFSTTKLIQISIASTFHLIKAGLQEAADVIHVCKTQPMNGLAAWWIHQLRGTPIYLDSDDHEALVNRFSHRWQQSIVAKFENWMPSFAEGITVSTSYLAKHFNDLGFPGERIHIIPHGIDVERFQILEQPDTESVLSNVCSSLNIQPKDRVVLFVGTMNLQNMAIDLLLEAFSELLVKEENALLLLVGGGEDLLSLQAEADKLGISHRVRFTGWIPSKLIPYYFRIAEVSVDPKRATVAEPSILSLKLLESIASETPCITADTGDSKTILGAAGLAVHPGDRSAIVDGLRTILGNPGLVARMQEAARELRSLYSWENRAHDFTSVYGNRSK